MCKLYDTEWDNVKSVIQRKTYQRAAWQLSTMCADFSCFCTDKAGFTALSVF